MKTLNYVLLQGILLLAAFSVAIALSGCEKSVNDDDIKPTYDVGETFGPNNEYRWHVGAGLHIQGEHSNVCHCDEIAPGGGWVHTRDADCEQYSRKP